MTKTFFVTATGTDLGKTYVLCRILEQLRQRGVAVSAVKPVLSGFEDALARESDAGQILLARGLAADMQSVAAIAPWRFRAPLSPDMAAAREEQVVRLDEVARFCNDALKRAGGLAFVEGAGGVLSPLGNDFTNLDLLKTLGAAGIVVAGGYLGTISHTLTAISAMQARGCAPVAIVLSGVQDGPVTLAETAATIARFTDVPLHLVERGGRVPDALLDMLQIRA
jgi:dethiobiotin synthetase